MARAAEEPDVVPANSGGYEPRLTNLRGQGPPEASGLVADAPPSPPASLMRPPVVTGGRLRSLLPDLLSRLSLGSVLRWRRPVRLVPDDGPPPPSPPPTPPPTNREEVGLTCPIGDCTWRVSSATLDKRVRLQELAVHLMQRHPGCDDIVAIRAHSLHRCRFCQMILVNDPSNQHQRRLCKGEGAPIMSENDYKVLIKQQTPKVRNERARTMAKEEEEARKRLAQRHDIHLAAVPRTGVGKRPMEALRGANDSSCVGASSGASGAGSAAASGRRPPSAKGMGNFTGVSAYGSDIRAFIQSVPARRDLQGRPATAEGEEGAVSDAPVLPAVHRVPPSLPSRAAPQPEAEPESAVPPVVQPATVGGAIPPPPSGVHLEPGSDPPLEALVHLVRVQALTPTSDVVRVGKSAMLTSLGKAQAATVQKAISSAVELVAKDVACAEAWTCMVVCMQLMLSTVTFPRGTPHEAKPRLVLEALRTRAREYDEGKAASLWDAHVQRIELPTSAKWEKQQKRMPKQVRMSIGEQAMQAIDSCDIKKGNTAIAAGVTAPPGEREHELLRGLLPHVPNVPVRLMQEAYTLRRFDRPHELALELHARLSKVAVRNANTVKWETVVCTAKTRKEPSGDGLRTEFSKRLFQWAPEAWAIVLEGIEARAVPVVVRELLTCPFVMQLLKRDAERRFSIKSKTRPIGLTCSLNQDALRPHAQLAAKILACILVEFGQVAVGIEAGGEAAAAAAQARCDLTKWAITVAIDQVNAFGLVENELTFLALLACKRVIETDETIQRRLLAQKIEVAAAVSEIEFMIDDLVWTRTHGFVSTTVVEGVLRRIWPTIGETQGGLFSALRYVVAKAFAVDRILALEFPGLVMRSIVDDGIMQMTVRSAADVATLVRWMWRLDELVKGVKRPPYADSKGELAITGVMGRLHFGKFKILQHVDACGTDFDLEDARQQMPFAEEVCDGCTVRRYPAVVRDMLEFNGLAIGFDAAARGKHLMQEVAILEERTARLVDVQSIVGRQRTEIYGRASYRASSVLVHQMRGVPPSIAASAMDRATQMQLALFRHVTGATKEMVGGAMEEWQGTASPRACASRCSLSVHLPSVMGGCNWPECRLVQAYIHAAARVDTYPTISRMADMSDYPHPAQWSSCAVPALREAAALLVKLVAMRGFHLRPPGDATAWERVYKLLVGPNRTVLWDNVPKLAGMKLQRVATRAYGYQLLLGLLHSVRVSSLTKIRFLAAAQPGAGEWCCLMGLATPHVHMDDQVFQRSVFARIGHPDALLSLQTRCVCAAYSADALPRVPGPLLSLKSPVVVSEMEHLLGIHWHQCLTNGMSTQGHNAVSHAWLRALKRLGYTGSVHEVPLGVDEHGAQVKADGVAKNFDVSATQLIWDTRVSSSYLSQCRPAAAADMFVVTDVNDKLKIDSKAGACQRSFNGRAEFLPVTCNSHGGLGRAAWEWLFESFQRKSDKAVGAAMKRAVRLEFETSVAEIGVAVLRRNAMIMMTNAAPQAGTPTPAPPQLFTEVQASDVHHAGL